MERDLAPVAAIIAEPARAAMLDALLSGRAMPAGELARVAGVSASTASEHLARMRQVALVDVVRQGRHRYYRLANVAVAQALEALAHIAPPRQIRSLRQSRQAESLAFARTCYDHVAGTLGVTILDGFLARDWLTDADGGYGVTSHGAEELGRWGVDVADARRRRRAFARPCLDWTERRYHLAGALAAAWTTRMLDLGWVVPRTSDSRALRLTRKGAAGVHELLRIDTLQA
ncbi:MAG: metalloregulator ArsR/SmtB family transcription factor [Streptosporangiales bacterium]|nr:metalloregulator ArsR/SmtB family transcription factor [Streptosporangiales bacterium]